jgi:hypothetical protein
MKSHRLCFYSKGIIGKTICILLIMSLISTLYAGEIPEKKTSEYLQGKIDGKKTASEDYSGGGWGAAGLGGGIVLGLIGAAAVVGASQLSSVEPPDKDLLDIASESDDYQTGFCDGYSRKAKNKRLIKSTIGGIMGTAIIVSIIISTRAWRESSNNR